MYSVHIRTKSVLVVLLLGPCQEKKTIFMVGIASSTQIIWYIGITFKTFLNSFSSSDYDADSQLGGKRGI